MEKILIIDDDDELCELLTKYLKSQNLELYAVHDGKTGLDLLSGNTFNLVVLDSMLPGGLNGFDVLKRLRTGSTIPLIMLSARGDEEDRIMGLEMGADDFLSKPFNPKELVARIKAVLRRPRYGHQVETSPLFSPTYKFGCLELDTSKYEVTIENEPVKLTHIEFQFLEILMKNYGIVVSREKLSIEVLGRPLLPFDRSIDVHVCNIRRKLRRKSATSVYIKAVRGSGYIFVEPALKDDNTSVNHQDTFQG